MEHATAVTMACKDKINLAIGIAVETGNQITLLVIPFNVILGWTLDKAMTLYFDEFQVAVSSIAVLLLNHIVQDGKSTWLESIFLMAFYPLVGIVSWFYPKEEYIGPVA